MLTSSGPQTEDEFRTLQIRSFIAQLIPPGIKPTARRIYHLPADALDSVLGRQNLLTPPKGRIFFGGGDFNRIGEEYFLYFVDLGGLQPDKRVLDVGCGIGRMAVPLDTSTAGAPTRGSTCFPRL